MEEKIKNSIDECIKVQEILAENQEIILAIKTAVRTISEALCQEKKILFCGNGGSAAEAQHLAAEFVGRFLIERPGLAAIALTTDSSVLTSISNDYDFQLIFQRQVEALGKRGDVFLGLSTSGNSENIRLAFQTAQSKGLMTIGLLGNNGGLLKNCADLAIIVPSKVTARIQESQLLIGHIICQLVEQELFMVKK